MKVCKYAGDPADEYCKSCDGCTMKVDENTLSCTECAGYEAGDVEVDTDTGEVSNNEPMNPPVEEPIEEKPVDKPVEKAHTAAKNNKTTNTTSKKEKALNEKNTKVETDNKVTIDTPIKVKEEKSSEETVKYSSDGIHVTALRYTSGATIKKGDNYFKFVAEEEWDVSQVDNVEDTREMLWAKLNAQVDSQIEELKNM